MRSLVIQAVPMAPANTKTLVQPMQDTPVLGPARVVVLHLSSDATLLVESAAIATVAQLLGLRVLCNRLLSKICTITVI